MGIKWNWGTGIALVNIGLVAAMLGLVYLCIKQDFDLVSDDYYEQELKFQQVIDGRENEKLLGKSTTVTIDDRQVTVIIPMENFDGEGTVTFYRPDNSKFDLAVPLNGNNSVIVPLDKLKNGLYKVKSSWQNAGKPYYNEQTLYVQ